MNLGHRKWIFWRIERNKISHSIEENEWKFYKANVIEYIIEYIETVFRSLESVLSRSDKESNFGHLENFITSQN